MEQTQADRVLAYLRQYRTVTQAEAAARLSVPRVQNVIHKLRKRGYEIEGTKPNPNGPTVYRLMELNRAPK